MTEALRQKRKILVSDHTPIMGWLLQKLITGFGLGLRELCRWFIKILFMAVMILSPRRDLPHPNHRSSGFNALMTYACCARMWARQSLCFPWYPCQRVSFQTNRWRHVWFICTGRRLYGTITLWLWRPFARRLPRQATSSFLHPTEIVVAHLIVTETENCFSQLWAKSQGNIGHYERDRKGAVVFSTPIQISTAFIMYPRSVFVQMLGEGLPKDTFAVALHMQDWMFILRKSQICSWPRYPRFGADRHCHLHHTFAFA